MKYSALSSGCRRLLVLLAVVIAWTPSALWAAPPADDAKTVRFSRDIKPILSDRCFLCHGPDEQQADFRLDERDSAIDWVIIPGDADNSELIARVTNDDPDEMMPPPKSHKPRLTEQEVELIKRWINEGAEYESHWAFAVPQRPAAPAVKQAAWPNGPIDTFALAKMEANNLAPSASADRRTLLRRVTFDLIGLPPTPGEIEAFVNDSSPQAYEKVVDRLLASPRFGEHQGRYWLDIARYADTNGYQYDTDRQQWVWRDWVIHALNTNMPFDEFTIQQMAGDLLPDATDQTRLATGFHRNHPITIEGGVIDEEYRTEYVMDRVVTTSTAFMGMTFLCARCHDHKYDPISQKEFYSFYAFFNNVPERGLNGFAPQAKIASPLQSAERAALDSRIAELEQRLKEVNANEAAFEQWEKSLREQAEAWSPVRAAEVVSTGGATLTLQDDGSYLASGQNPAVDTYEVTFTVGETPVRSLRLEALPHDSFVNKSVGRGSNGNFVLAEVEVAAGADPASLQPLKFASATADYEQQGYPAAAAIDGAHGRGGWAVDGNTRFAASTLFLTLADEVPAGSTVRLRLVHTWGGSHMIGRFRLSTTKDELLAPAVSSILATTADKRTAEQSQALKQFLLRRFGGSAASSLADELQQAQAKRNGLSESFPNTLIMAEMPKPRQAYVLDRGEYDKPLKDAPVAPAVPAAMGQLPADAPANRLGLAQWFVSRDNPLTARVTVNRYWAQLFGTGLVETVEDFGAQGEYPSHPDLLDWLAVEFIESGWDVKHLFKTMVMSNTYRQSSVVSPEAHANDPKNRLLARGPRFRLEAETIRDSALAVAGLLDKQVGGPSVFPYHPQGLWLEINNRPGYSRAYPHTTAADNLYRRSLYTYWKRTVPPPSLATFDAPEREFCIARRSRTNTPLQAFVMLHDPQYVEAARMLAERMVREGGKTPAERLAYGFEVCTGRTPSAAELTVLTATYDERLVQYRSDAAAAEKLLSIGQAPRDKSLDAAEHAATTSAARLLLNLSEFITRG